MEEAKSARGEQWLEILGKEIDARDIMRLIRQRIAARRSGDVLAGSTEEPVAVAEELWEKMIEDQAKRALFPLSQRECDIVPRGYVIEWRVPVLGPIHAMMRRFINAEIRRYLLPALEQQSALNWKMSQVLSGLLRENELLRREVKVLQQRLEQDR